MIFNQTFRHYFDIACAHESEARSDTRASEKYDKSLKVWVKFQLTITDGQLVSIHFNLYGCPYTIAMCGVIIDSFLGQSLENITAEALDNKMLIIDLPREHFGKFIIIKEAFFEELNCSIH